MMQHEDLQERLDQLRRTSLTMSDAESRVLAAGIIADAIERMGDTIADALITASGGEV